MSDGKDETPGEPKELNPKAWSDINEAVGEALSLPPAEAFDLLADEPVALPQKKREGEGVRFQTVTSVNELEADQRDKLLQAQELENRRALARAWKLFREDGSLLGEYAPLMGQSTTPDTVDALWWLSLPEAQAKWELGLDKGDDATYSRVRRDIEAMAAAVINRMLQTRTVVPMVIRRKRNKVNRELFQGGSLKRLKAVNPNDYPGMDTSRRNKRDKRDKATTEDEPPVEPFDPHAPI
jgi:hypothetical protein